MTRFGALATPLFVAGAIAAGCAHAPPPPLPDATLSVRGPAGAQVFVDDRYAGPAAGAPLSLRSGWHRVEVRADGCLSEYREVTLVPGARFALEVVLRPDLDGGAR